MITSLTLPPALVLIAGAMVLPLLRGTTRNGVMLALPLLTFALLWTLPDGAQMNVRFLDFDLVVAKVDKLSRLFALVFTVMAMAGALYAVRQPRTMELAAAFGYAGSAIGAVMAGDLITLFAFWELMAIGSTIVILCGGKGSDHAAFRYAVIHLFGGVLLMAGVAGEIQANGSIVFGRMDTSSVPRMLILAGFLVNAGAPPLTAWLSDAYPKASWSGIVFLSAFTTKTAIYVLLRGFPGTEILIAIGLFLAFYGIVYAILEDDIRRQLVYGIVTKVGFMLIGIGIGTDIALDGVAGQAAAHIVYKALLLMVAGWVMVTYGTTKYSELSNKATVAPAAAITALVAALAMTSFPFTAGFAAKSMILQAAADQHRMWLWLALVAISAGIVAQVPWRLVVGDLRARGKDKLDTGMLAGMVLLAVLAIAPGVLPAAFDPLMRPFATTYDANTASHILFQLQLLAGAGLGLALLHRMVMRTPGTTLDLDVIWRRAGKWVMAGLDDFSGRCWDALIGGTAMAASKFARMLDATHGPEGIWGRTPPTGRMALWTTLMLGAYLVLSYI